MIMEENSAILGTLETWWTVNINIAQLLMDIKLYKKDGLGYSSNILAYLQQPHLLWGEQPLPCCQKSPYSPGTRISITASSQTFHEINFCDLNSFLGPLASTPVLHNCCLIALEQLPQCYQI